MNDGPGEVHDRNSPAWGRLPSYAARLVQRAAAADGQRRGEALALAQGVFNVGNGLWPLVHMRSFEAVFGPKTDRWLVRTVAGLMVSNGVAQIRSRRPPAALAHARQIGVGTAVTLAAIDLAYAPTGRISRMYLLDAAIEAAWITAWLTSRDRPPKPDLRSPVTKVTRGW
jgi:hypothetical protein